eukprot:g36871.t1
MPGHFEIKIKVMLDLLKSIKVDKSQGPDGIYPRSLREAREVFSGALTKIFVSLLATGGVPEDWEEVEAPERVQKWFTRMLPGLQGMSYKKRLEKLGLFSPKRRRLTGALKEVYKIMRCIDRLTVRIVFLSVEMSNAKGHAFK